MLTGGKLADYFGRRLIFMVGLVDLHRRVPRVRARAERRSPDRRARRAGPRRRADEPGDALDHHRDLRAARARHGDRHLGRRLGDGARDRPARRRPPHRARELELDLLHQRPDRHRSGSFAIPRLHRRVARRVRASSASTSPGSSPRPSASSRSPTRSSRRTTTAGRSTRILGSFVVAAVALVAFILLERHQRAADARPVALPQPHVHRRERRDAVRRARDVRRRSSSSRSTCRTCSATRRSRRARASCR